MKTNFIYLGALLICLSSCKKEETKAEETVVEADTITVKETAPPVAMDSVAMNKAWEEYATVGEPHKVLSGDVGTWTEDLTFWMGPEDKNPQKHTATADIKMILGGRYQEQRHKGKMMGMDFEGISTMAYNNASGEYTSTWIDNMGTGMMIASGKYDEATKTINLSGEMVDPLTKKLKKFREVMSIVDADTRKMESFDTSPDGKEFKSMEIVMKRKK